MPRKLVFLLIYLTALVVYALVAWPHTHPPYMDSFYYVDIARNLAHGQGLTEGFVWNYLAGMLPLRHPSSEYWLPGMSLLLAPVLALGGGYHGAALLTCAVAALCPVLAAMIGYDVFGTSRHALTMAGLTLFNGVWFHDWTTPDAFVLYAALATVTLLLAYRGLQGRGRYGGAAFYALAGFTAGLAALVRQEGVFLLAALLVAALLTRDARRRLWPRGVLGAVALYGLVMLPWLLHNYVVLGALGATGGNRTLWMRSYDAFYALHTAELTPHAYLLWGWAHIIGARLHAIVFTLTSWIFLWLVVLVPPLLAGLWRLGRRVELRPFLIYWGLLALALPLVFTVTLENGTLGHASGALLPFGSALVVGGLDVIGVALARVRPWLQAHGRRRRQNEAASLDNAAGIPPQPSQPAGDPLRLAGFMNVLALSLAIVVSVGMARQTFPVHGDEYTRDAQVVAWLHRHNLHGRPVMVLDPPAFAYLDDRAYVVAPSDGVAAALTVARHYGVSYWALDPLHAPAQDALYSGRVHVAGLRRVAIVDGVQMYRVESMS